MFVEWATGTWDAGPSPASQPDASPPGPSPCSRCPSSPGSGYGPIARSRRRPRVQARRLCDSRPRRCRCLRRRSCHPGATPTSRPGSVSSASSVATQSGGASDGSFTRASQLQTSRRRLYQEKGQGGSHTHAARGVLAIRGDRGFAFAIANNMQSEGETDAKLVFHKYGDQHYLREVWLGGGYGRELPRNRPKGEPVKTAGGGTAPVTFERVIIAAR
jgi:hypothetical protein